MNGRLSTALRTRGRPVVLGSLRFVSRLYGAMRRHPLLTVLIWMWVVASGVAYAGPTTPTGMGGLLPLPDLSAGTQKSLLESTNWLTWSLDADYGRTQIWQPIVMGLASIFWGAATAVVYGAILLTWWLLSVAGFNKETAVLADAIGNSSTELLAWMLPSALVIGLLWAWIQHKGAGLLGSLSWVIAAAVMGLSLSMAPQLWVDGVNNVRSVGADTIMTVTSQAVSPNQQKPFPWTATNYGGGSGPVTCDSKAGKCEAPKESADHRENTMLRKTGDAVWRGLVASPWCIAEFGSMAACERYGAPIIKRGTDVGRRTGYINNTVKKQEGGGDAATYKWTKGEKPFDRLMIALLSLVVNIIFCGVLLVLGGNAAVALISTFFHLFLGVPFVTFWCIEGRPRQIGMRWLESLIGTLIQSIASLAIFSAMLVLITVEFSTIGASGWLPTIGTAILIMAAALAFRKQLVGFFGVIGGGGRGAMLLGAMVMRGLSGMRRRLPLPGKGRGSTGGGGLGGGTSRGGGVAGAASRRRSEATPPPRHRTISGNGGRPPRRPAVIGSAPGSGAAATMSRRGEQEYSRGDHDGRTEQGGVSRRPDRGESASGRRRDPSTTSIGGMRRKVAPSTRRPGGPTRGGRAGAGAAATRQRAAQAERASRQATQSATKTQASSRRASQAAIRIEGRQHSAERMSRPATIAAESIRISAPTRSQQRPTVSRRQMRAASRPAASVSAAPAMASAPGVTTRPPAARGGSTPTTQSRPSESRTPSSSASAASTSSQRQPPTVRQTRQPKQSKQQGRQPPPNQQRGRTRPERTDRRRGGGGRRA